MTGGAILLSPLPALSLSPEKIHFEAVISFWRGRRELNKETNECGGVCGSRDKLINTVLNLKNEDKMQMDLRGQKLCPELVQLRDPVHLIPMHSLGLALLIGLSHYVLDK